MTVERLRKILWLTDIHMTDPGRLVRGRDPAGQLAAAIDHAMRHHTDIDACIVTGDLTDNAKESEYARVRAALDRLAVPVAVTLGNHDGRSGFWRVFPASPGAAAPGCAHGILDVGRAWRILLVDSMGDRLESGGLGAHRLAWLDARLAEAASRKVLLFMHHPPLALGLPPFDNSSLSEDDRAAFARCLGRHRDRVRLVGFGHCHMAITGTLNGIPAVGMGSVLYQALPNFADATFRDDPVRPGVYGVILLTETDAIVHMVDFHP